jgi:hypothetical protein
MLITGRSDVDSAINVAGWRRLVAPVSVRMAMDMSVAAANMNVGRASCCAAGLAKPHHAHGEPSPVDRREPNQNEAGYAAAEHQKGPWIAHL